MLEAGLKCSFQNKWEKRWCHNISLKGQRPWEPCFIQNSHLANQQLLCSASGSLTCCIVLVVVDEVRDGVKHMLFCQVVSLGKVSCLIDVIMLDNRIVVRAEKEEVFF